MNNQDNPNKNYKRKIRALIAKVEKGDKSAERELSHELDKSSTARWVLNHMLKLKGENSKKNRGSSSKIKARKNPKYGNAYKPYQGGAPGLGKKS